MVKTAQQKVLRFIVQTERKYKSKKDAANKKEDEIDKHAREGNKCASDKETEEVSYRNSKKDQDSDVSFQEDTGEEIDATKDAKIGRSTQEAEKHLKKSRYHAGLKFTEDKVVN